MRARCQREKEGQLERGTGRCSRGGNYIESKSKSQQQQQQQQLSMLKRKLKWRQMDKLYGRAGGVEGAKEGRVGKERGNRKNFSIILIIFEIAFNTSWPEQGTVPDVAVVPVDVVVGIVVVVVVVPVIAVVVGLLVVRKTINGDACIAARLG